MAKKLTYEDLEQRVKELEEEVIKNKNSDEELLSFQAIFENIQVGLYIYYLEDINDDKTLKMISANQAAADYTGVSIKDVMGKTLDENFPGLREKGIPQIYAEVVRSGELKILEEISYGDNRVIQGAFSVKAFPLPNNCVGVSFENITERKRVEEASRKKEERFRLLAENVTDVIWTMDMNLRFTYVSPSVLQLQGYTVEEAMAQSLDEIMVPESRVMATSILNQKLQLIESGDDEGWEPISFEIEQYCKDGTTIITRNNAKILKGSDGRPNLILGVTHDITESKRTEEALKESEKRYRNLLEISPDAIAIVQGFPPRHLFVNSAYTKLLGYTLNDVERGFSPFKTIQEADRAEIEKKMHDRHTGREVAPRYDQVNLVSKKGRIFPCEIIATLINYGGQTADMLVIRDISEHIRAEEEKASLESQLQQAHKMEAVGTLAGGIAHEFNNALSGLFGNIEILKMDFPEDETIEKFTAPMMKSSRRMARLTDQLLAYAGGGKYREKTISLNDFVENTLPILQHSVDSEIRVETDLTSDVLNVKADVTQMQMVLSAAIKNASEAIEGRGRIRITTNAVGLDKVFAESHPGLKTGPHVCITIKDNGRGMDDETTSKIFEPFFTTKFQGRGLGMAAAFGIVMNHDGLIVVDSELGKGTEIRIYLPAVEVESKEPKEPKVEVSSGTGTILLIEDEKIVLDVTRALLEKLGYRVLEARSGKEAIDIAESFDGDIDLALLDIGLPDMDGGKVYPTIKKARPNLKVIVCSGYAFDGPAQAILDNGAQDFIQKPYSLSTLSEKLSDVLENR